MGRTIGVVYLAYFVVAMIGETLRSHGLIIVGIATNLLAYGVYAALVLLFYRLFKPVNANIALLAACFGILGCIAGTLQTVHLAPFGVNQLFFFAFYCLLVGYLIVKSNVLPWFLGVLMMLAGVGWLIFLLPIAGHAAPYIEALGIVAEALLMLWLLIFGTHAQVTAAQRSS
jgi:hypothetical protein